MLSAECWAFVRGAAPRPFRPRYFIGSSELAGSPVLDDMGDFLHLTLVRVAGRPAEVPQMWRVRLSEVAGWGLGHSTDETQEFRRAQPQLPSGE